MMKKVRLTATEWRALSLIRDGADVTLAELALTLRKIWIKHPELLNIVNPPTPEIYRRGRKPIPFFGAILTAVGCKALISHQVAKSKRRPKGAIRRIIQAACPENTTLS